MTNKQHSLVKLAKETITNFVLNNEIIAPPDWLEEEYLKNQSGVFVTVKQNGELRGCIGTYLPTKENVAREIITNAIAAASEDPRFRPITENELPSLSYEIYILEKPVPIANIEEINPMIYGIIVFGADSKKSGLLLPGLEGINTVQQQLSIACQKAGIDPEKEKIHILKFKTQKF